MALMAIIWSYDRHKHAYELSEFETKLDRNRTNRVYLLGERNSGTNYIEDILKSSLMSKYGHAEGRNNEYPYSSGIPIIDFKHMFRHDLLDQKELETLQANQDSLWLLVVRSPCSWADGMYRKPWHLCPPSDVTCLNKPYVGLTKLANSREDFFRTPWTDWVEAQRSEKFNYSSVFALRTRKLKLMGQLMEIMNRVKLVHLSQVECDPKRFMTNLARQFNLDLKPGALDKLKPSKLTHPEPCLSKKEHEISMKEIDWNVEMHFGFNYLDCHTCESVS